MSSDAWLAVSYGVPAAGILIGGLVWAMWLYLSKPYPKRKPIENACWWGFWLGALWPVALVLSVIFGLIESGEYIFTHTLTSLHRRIHPQLRLPRDDLRETGEAREDFRQRQDPVKIPGIL